jgi:signal transduction histidine kinase
MKYQNDHIDFSQKLSELGELSEKLNLSTDDEFRKIVAEGVCHLLGVPVCILWERQLETKFKISTHHGNVDEGYRCLELDDKDPNVKYNLSRTRKVWSSSIEKVSSKFVHSDKLKSHQWRYIMSATLKESGRSIGILDVYTTENHGFQPWQKDLFRVLVGRVSAFLINSKCSHGLTTADAAHAIERRKAKLVERITHELKSPIIGIKANASFIQRTFDDLRYSPQRIVVKMQDILTDCDLLLYQVRQLEYFLGRVSSDSINEERIPVFKDIILKTINELGSHMKDEYGFSVDRIKFDRDLIQEVVVSTDKAKLNQVVFNLMINSLKYAKDDPDDFKLLIEAEEHSDTFVVKFLDWGIGIDENDHSKVFDEGFRSKEAITKVGGSGLGLHISRVIMKQLGGDLRLFNSRNPTEFHLILPKTIQHSSKQ